MPRYNPAVIEPKWQLFWEQHKTFAAPRLPGEQKLYALDMFPYPSGDGLHVGHPEGYTATDIVCRAARMQGKSVIHPMGFDSFGLPAEEHAIKTGTHPRIQTEANIANFRRQLKMLGFSYDWDRELATTDAAYVKWTQWIFLQIYDTWYDTQQDRGRPIAELPIPQEVSAAGDDAVQRYRDTHRLAYQSEAPVNWCPALGTVLANEEVIDGKSERGGHPVVRMPLLQWKLRITAYADRLTNDLADLDWSESIKILQRNWIGKSTGAEVDFFIGAAEGSSPTAAFAAWHGQRAESGFPAEPGDDVLRVYTTRPDTLFGATYMVVAPEHPFVARLTTAALQDSVEAYCQAASFKSDLDRTELAKEKTGVFTGSYAINPVNGHPIPIWVADYVLISYGTGAIMAVPAHDERDFEFARQFQIPIVPVVDPGQGHPARDGVLAGAVVSSDDGAAINSGRYDGMATADFKKRIRDDLVTDGIGSAAVNYKLRDWLFSRQRFWGEPFPIWHEIDEQGNLTGLRRPVAEQDLPVDLPHLDDFLPHGRPEPPLEKAPEDWLYCELEGRRYKRETNTMPQWAGSCWYYLRFLDPGNERALVDPEVERNWMPVDLYVGGAEHAVLHLLYARFWHKVLYDRGVVSTAEPFQRLINQGMILGEMECTAFREGTGEWVSATDVNHDSDAPVREETAALLHSVSVPLADVTKQGDSFVLTADPTIRVDSRAHKMSKSRGNVVNPDEVVKEYGADSLRLYEMYMGPLEATKPWSMEGVKGVFRFLNRVWRLVVDESAEVSIPTAAGALSSAVVDAVPANEVNRELHKTIKKVTHDIAALAFNTALARMMEFTNLLTKQKRHSQQVLEPLVLILSPFAPHMCEELWSILGHNESLAYEPWPAYDDKIARDENVVIPVQINGKVRAKVEISVAADRNALESAAREDARIADLLAGSNIVKVIVVPGRLVNFVLRG